MPGPDPDRFVTGVEILQGGTPTEDELAAIVAAIELTWPRSRASGAQQREKPERWRFSGRWWSKPVPARRDRPH